MMRLHRLLPALLLASTTLLPAEAGWTDLLAGDQPETWRSTRSDNFPAHGWSLQDGVLTIHKPVAGQLPGGDIITRARYANFELELEVLLTPGCNSGIKFFVQLNAPVIDSATGRPTPSGSALGPEFQILDDARHPDARGGRDGNRTIGSLYDLTPAATAKVVKPIGEWNHVRIIARRSHIEFWLNGQKTLEFDRHSAAFRALVAQSKYHNIPQFAEWTDGHILLQDHGDEVSYRRIRIRALPAE